MEKKKVAFWLIIAAAVVTLITSTATAVSGIKGWFGKEDDSSVIDTSTQACIEMVVAA